VESTPPLTATLTFKKDGSHFTGTVVRREPNSITVTGSAGDVHTFLYGELADIKYGVVDAKGDTDKDATAPSVATAPPTTGSSASVAGDVIELPQGVSLPVRSNGFLDSCCVPIGAIALGRMDTDIKNSKGAVLIPEGANVTFTLRNESIVDGRVVMQFELGTTDFNNRHFIISSSKGGTEPGATVSFTGPKEGSPEAKARGKSVHLDDNSAMPFKAETALVFKLSQ